MSQQKKTGTSSDADKRRQGGTDGSEKTPARHDVDAEPKRGADKPKSGEKPR